MKKNLFAVASILRIALTGAILFSVAAFAGEDAERGAKAYRACVACHSLEPGRHLTGPSLANVLIALTLIGWVGYARLVRGQVLRAREFEYVQAARALGAGTPRILWRHVVPSAIPAVVVQTTLGMAGAIIGEAALSFLGLGVQPPTPSWGTMLNGGRAHLLDAPHLTIFPGLAIALLVLGFNFVGDGLRDLADPKQVRR